MLNCQKCKDAGQPDTLASERRCAFDSNGIFQKDNWMCETMLMLRNEAEELGFRTRDDDESFGFVPYNGFFIAISWYKERGRTGNAVVMQDEMDATLLTLEFAETVVRERCGV